MMTPEEREQALKKMDAITSAFYREACQVGNHPYIEFCGFMTEYLKLARAAHAQGIDFSEANDHSGLALPIEPYQAEYIAEKFGCIFGPTFRSNPKAWKAFCSKVMEVST